jgi:hypothetical protein
VTSARRIFWTALAFGACLGGFSATAHAAATGQSPCWVNWGNNVCESHGDRVRTNSAGTTGGSDNGTRSYISGSGYATPVPGEIIAYVAIQDGSYQYGTAEDTIIGRAGVVITGELERTGIAQDACGNGTATEAFFAYRISGQASFHCPYTEAINPHFGSGGLFDVVYQNGAWHANQNGNQVGTASGLGFTSGWSIAGDQAWVVKNNSTPNSTQEAVTFGQAGNNPWQYTTNNGSTYTNVSVSQADQNTDTDGDSDGDWSLGGTPSPFNIKWTGY